MHHQNFKVIIACMIFLQLISTTSNGQQLNYKDYQFPKVDYKSLQLNENLNLGNNASATDRSTRFSNSLFLNGSRYINNDNKQYYNSRTFSSIINTASASNAFNTTAISDEIFRKYRGDNKFFEYGYHAGIYNNIRTKTNAYNNLSAYLNIPLKVGVGRINILNEVMLAEFIIDDLRREDILTDTISQDMIFAFAGEIAKFNFTRILDNRNFRLQVLRSLSIWLKSNFPVKAASDIELTTILIDNYSFAGIGFRSIGSRFAVGIDPNISYSKYFKDGEYSFSSGGALSMEFSVQKPISRYLQSNFYTIISLDINKSKNTFYDSKEATISNVISPKVLVAYKMGYYPNSRTNVELTTLMNYIFYKMDYEDQRILDIKSTSIAPKIMLQSSYFINYKLRLFANFEVVYFHSFVKDFLNDPNMNFIPDDFSYNVSDWYIGRTFDPSLTDRNGLGTRQLQNKVSYAFNAGFVFNIY
ncbi:MAG: hypothetical protein IPO45_03635 [Saprospiraceae bacterium]|jgi:hypothetical protein|uniref:hypothetical protein n=1 Tax=Candidatus Brachybacter algidus TaxID=2982024 RepID=UPI001B66E280|nr:hypothetical protein [Candidatus Brachybacter algidus]MBP7305234.1 hypothetical protein [Saprospiraceae bacterium]MBK6448813.1 hypothetical protein [Candidatus Brachybacter algidus]MBK7603722.1 hypothetical protein [Candidatus Brachybacter algidus]MBK8357143.1 hypothetical protein [Candidatus Brachybacter algidus]MBK8843209.1 hypothetical protein [Candidatus Brachybacter algidus]